MQLCSQKQAPASGHRWQTPALDGSTAGTRDPECCGREEGHYHTWQRTRGNAGQPHRWCGVARSRPRGKKHTQVLGRRILGKHEDGPGGNTAGRGVGTREGRSSVQGRVANRSAKHIGPTECLKALDFNVILMFTKIKVKLLQEFSCLELSIFSNVKNIFVYSL